MPQQRPLTVEIQPDARTVEVQPGTPLSAALERAGIPINYPCGGSGICGNCRVSISGAIPPATTAEEELLDPEALAAGVRLACCAEIAGPCIVTIDPATRVVEPVILTSAAGRDVPLEPLARKFHLQLPQATTTTPEADHDIVLRTLAPAHPGIIAATPEYLRRLPRAIAAGNRSVTLTIAGDKIINVQPGNTMDALFGVSIDIGTTTVAASLHSLRSGKQLAVAAALNPQTQHGADVITRLTYVYGSGERLAQLQEKIIACINDLIGELCTEAGASASDIAMLTIAGNAAMNHLFAGVPPEQIALAPYTPVFRRLPPFEASDLRLQCHPTARVEVLPNIGGFVGGDTVAGLLACDFLNRSEPRLFIDIGTNCEIVLGVGDRLFAASAPAGPALEGGCISCGMRAETGAISDVTVEDGRLRLHTINNAEPRGLCGSGLIHLAAALRQIGAIESGGTFASPDSIHENCRDDIAGRYGMRGGRRAFRIADDIWLTQNDVREFQYAKAAISSAWRTLCQEAGIDAVDIQSVFLAGAFGNFMRVDAAHEIGIVPPCPLASIRAVGNTALEGARLVLLNARISDEIDAIMSRTKFVELAGRDDFQELFAMELMV